MAETTPPVESAGSSWNYSYQFRKAYGSGCTIMLKRMGELLNSLRYADAKPMFSPFSRETQEATGMKLPTG